MLLSHMANTCVTAMGMGWKMMMRKQDVEDIYVLFDDAEMRGRISCGCRTCSEYRMLLTEKCLSDFMVTAFTAMYVVPLSLQSALSSTPAGRGS